MAKQPPKSDFLLRDVPLEQWLSAEEVAATFNPKVTVGRMRQILNKRRLLPAYMRAGVQKLRGEWYIHPDFSESWIIVPRRGPKSKKEPEPKGTGTGKRKKEPP
jgi:hypothetical protein